MLPNDEPEIDNASHHWTALLHGHAIHQKAESFVPLGRLGRLVSLFLTVASYYTSKFKSALSCVLHNPGITAFHTPTQVHCYPAPGPS